MASEKKLQYRISAASIDKLFPQLTSWERHFASQSLYLGSLLPPSELLCLSSSSSPLSFFMAHPNRCMCRNQQLRQRIVMCAAQLYVCESLDARSSMTKTSERTNIARADFSCAAYYVMPFAFQIQRESSPTFLRYHNLQVRHLITAPGRHTMLRKRPSDSPKTDPRVWWEVRHCLCHVSSQLARQWHDIFSGLGKRRGRFIELV
jgi:hypothetical protein